MEILLGHTIVGLVVFLAGFALIDTLIKRWMRKRLGMNRDREIQRWRVRIDAVVVLVWLVVMWWLSRK